MTAVQVEAYPYADDLPAMASHEDVQRGRPISCVGCGATKVTIHHRTQRYCSRKCGAQHRTPTPRAKADPVKHFVICALCGTKKQVRVEQRKTQRYCSPKCANRARATSACTTKYRKRFQPDHPLAGVDGMVRVNRAVLFAKVGPGSQTCHWCARTIEWKGTGPSRLVSDHLDTDTWNNDPSNLVPSCHRCNAHRIRLGENFVTHCVNGHERAIGTVCVPCRRKAVNESAARRRARLAEGEKS